MRDARLGDHQALCGLWRITDELHARLKPGYFRRPGPGMRTPEKLERILAAPDERLRVACTSDGVMGLCHVLLYDTPPLPWVTPARRGHIDTLVVAPIARRRGIGRLLVEDGVAWARGRGAVEIVLTVWAGNDEATRFYEAIGFQAINTVLGRSLI